MELTRAHIHLEKHKVWYTPCVVSNFVAVRNPRNEDIRHGRISLRHLITTTEVANNLWGKERPHIHFKLAHNIVSMNGRETMRLLKLSQMLMWCGRSLVVDQSTYTRTITGYAIHHFTSDQIHKQSGSIGDGDIHGGGEGMAPL